MKKIYFFSFCILLILSCTSNSNPETSNNSNTSNIDTMAIMKKQALEFLDKRAKSSEAIIDIVETTTTGIRNVDENVVDAQKADYALQAMERYDYMAQLYKSKNDITQTRISEDKAAIYKTRHDSLINIIKNRKDPQLCYGMRMSFRWKEKSLNNSTLMKENIDSVDFFFTKDFKIIEME